MDKKYVVTFKNTHTAIKAESEAKKNKINVIVIPTPTFITKSCGISLRIEEEYILKFKRLKGIIEYKNIYEENKGEYIEIE